MASCSDALPAHALRAIATANGYPLAEPAFGDREGTLPGIARRTGLVVNLLAAAALALMAASTDGATEQRLLSGGAIGTSLGAFGTALTGGCIPCGAMIGLVAGTGAGHFYDTYEHPKRPSVELWRIVE